MTKSNWNCSSLHFVLHRSQKHCNDTYLPFWSASLCFHLMIGTFYKNLVVALHHNLRWYLFLLHFISVHFQQRLWVLCVLSFPGLPKMKMNFSLKMLKWTPSPVSLGTDFLYFSIVFRQNTEVDCFWNIVSFTFKYFLGVNKPLPFQKWALNLSNLYTFYNIDNFWLIQILIKKANVYFQGSIFTCFTLITVSP